MLASLGADGHGNSKVKVAISGRGNENALGEQPWQRGRQSSTSEREERERARERGREREHAAAGGLLLYQGLKRVGRKTVEAGISSPLRTSKNDLLSSREVVAHTLLRNLSGQEEARYACPNCGTNQNQQSRLWSFFRIDTSDDDDGARLSETVRLSD